MVRKCVHPNGGVIDQESTLCLSVLMSVFFVCGCYVYIYLLTVEPLENRFLKYQHPFFSAFRGKAGVRNVDYCRQSTDCQLKC